jgi:hypothetical protein
MMFISYTKRENSVVGMNRGEIFAIWNTLFLSVFILAVENCNNNGLKRACGTRGL